MPGSAYPPSSGSHGTNPDYYAETANTGSHQQDQQQPPAYSEFAAPAQQNFSPPPPAQTYTSSLPQHQPYLPHEHTTPLQGGPHLSTPPGIPYQAPPPPPSYGGNPSNIPTEEKPAIPPRPPQTQNHAYYAPPLPGPRPDVGAGPSYAPPPQSPYAPGASAGAAHPPPPSDAQISSSKSGWLKRFDELMVKAGKPINKLTNKLGSEAFWPGDMASECDKCARILKSFTVRKADQASLASAPVTSQPTQPTPHGQAPAAGPKKDSKALVKIPPKIIANAKGLAIFTTFRTGLHISGAGGSGIVMSRLPNGDWSPPSGILVHTLGIGLIAGADIYDCVCVLNTDEAVRAFTNPRVSLGGEIAVVAGPIGAGAAVEGAVGQNIKPVYSYMKSRGLYGGLQADGTVILTRPDANEEFYKRKVNTTQILAGEVQWPPAGTMLREVARDAEGKTADYKVVSGVYGETLGDMSPDGYGGKPAMDGGVRYG